MSYPYRQPKKLQRSRNDRWIGGVCGGLAEYLNMDATLLRVLVIVLGAVTAFFPVAVVYFLLMALLPESQQLPPSSIGPHQRPYGADQFGPGRYTGQYGQPSQEQQPYSWSSNGSSAPTDPVWGSSGAPWQQNAAADVPLRPKPNPEDLFSRAKHPTQPSAPTSATGTGSATGTESPASTDSSAGTDSSASTGSSANTDSSAGTEPPAGSSNQD